MAKHELKASDFRFDGRFGSHGARIEKVGRNHFHMHLAHAPNHPEWFNLPQFEIVRNARGNSLRLDVSFARSGDSSRNIRFNHDASTWSYDARNWRPVEWLHGHKAGDVEMDTLVFPEFEEDTVYCGVQVPMAYEDVVEFMARYGRHPDARVQVIGQSLGGRNIYRLEITDRAGDNREIRKSGRELEQSAPEFLSSRLSDRISPSRRWGFHVNQQHSGEHHGKWRMIGMIDWLLSEAGADLRKRSVWHFVLEMSPDAPTHGWYRISAAGVDLNRAYLVTGSDPAMQPHEAYVLQKDFEALMASETPIAACWSMHTWPGEAEPVMYPGQEVGRSVGQAAGMASLLEKLDTKGLIKPLRIEAEKQEPTICWHNGPHQQFGITCFLCEGSDFWTDKNLSIEVGRVFIQAMAEYYRGLP